MEKKRNGFFLILLGALIFFLSADSAMADEGSYTFTFQIDQLRFEEISGYDVVRYTDLDFTQEVGAPQLPVQVVRFLIPPGQSIAGVVLHEVQEEEIAGEYDVYPVQPPHILSQKAVQFVPPDPETYASSQLFPERMVEVVHRGYVGGYQVGAVVIHPVRYLASQRRLVLCSRIALEIVYEETGELRRPVVRSNYAGSIQQSTLRSLVVNPQAGIQPSVDDMSASSNLQEEEHAYVIITTEDLEAQFRPLADWKLKKGLSADIFTVSWIRQNYFGWDVQESIRNFIIDAHKYWGTVWVLLGGDTGVIPDRKAFAMDCEYGDFSDNWIPCDLYYADLDGDWNANRNDIYGEVDDNIDLYPDVFVGRASVENTQEAAAFVDKILTYEKYAGADHALNMLFLAGVCWSDPFTNSGDSKDLIDEQYVPPRFDPITKLYTVMQNDDLASVLRALNQGQHFINHSNHAWYTGVSLGSGLLGVPEINGLSNAPNYGIFYSIGCWPAAFDYDCFAEHFITNPVGGGVAFIGNSRYGWGSPGNPEYGYSDRLDQEFFKVLFEDGLYHIGQTLSTAKAVYAPFSGQENVYRWHQYQVNLLGDPEMPIWTDEPGQLIVTYPTELPLENGLCNVTVTDDSGVPVDDALVCLMQETTVYQTLTTGADGQARFEVDGASPADPLHITVTAHNYIPFEDTIVVQAQGPFVQVSAFSTNGSDADYVKPGTSVVLDVRFENVGMDTARGIDVILHHPDGQITLEDSTVAVPLIEPGESVMMADAFSFGVDSNVVNGEVIYLDCEMTDEEGRQWQDRLSVTGATPVLSFVSYTVSDSTAGDGDGVVEPGETVHIQLLAQNAGLDSAREASVSMTSPNDIVQFTSPTVNIGNLKSRETVSLALEAVVDASCGSLAFPPVDVEFNTQRGYQFTDRFYLTVGNVVFVDDMEDVTQNWTHSGTPDLWHVTTARKHSGNHSWYCGNIGQYCYDNNMTDNSLTSKPIVIGRNAELTFWAWYECPNYGVTGFYVEVNDGSDWTVLDFIGSGGALGTLPTGMDWYEYAYDLSDYTPGTSLRIRFRFQSDAEIATEGIYIDDVIVQDEHHDIHLSAPPVPPAPVVSFADEDTSIVLTWDVDSGTIDEIESFSREGYAFQGYNVYQLYSSNPFLNNGMSIATFDVEDGVTEITEGIIDPVRYVKEEVIRQAGSDSGLQYTFRIGKDYLDDLYFIQGRPYYYAVTAYTYNADSGTTPRCTESVVNVIEYVYQADTEGPAYGDTLQINHITGTSDAVVAPIIRNPNVFTGHTYRVNFAGDGTDGLSYSVMDMSTQTVLLDRQPLSLGKTQSPVVDGFQLVFEALELMDFKEYSVQGNGDYDISSYLRQGWGGPTARAIDIFGYGTTDIEELCEDYELRFTGEYENPNAELVYVREGTGSMATLIDARQYNLADHPMNPNPGSGNPFMVRIPFEVWNVDDNRQVNFVILDREQEPGDTPFYAFNPYGRMYCWILNTPYHETPMNWNINEQDHLTWNLVFWETDFRRGDVVSINYPNPLTTADAYTFSTDIDGSPGDDIVDFTYDLLQNYPNPFNTRTTIRFRLVQSQLVTISIYNLLGKQIREFRLDGNRLQVEWDGTDTEGRTVSSGVYFYKMVTGDFEKVRKMILLR